VGQAGTRTAPGGTPGAVAVGARYAVKRGKALRPA